MKSHPRLEVLGGYLIKGFESSNQLQVMLRFGTKSQGKGLVLYLKEGQSAETGLCVGMVLPLQEESGQAICW